LKKIHLISFHVLGVIEFIFICYTFIISNSRAHAAVGGRLEPTAFINNTVLDGSFLSTSFFTLILNVTFLLSVSTYTLVASISTLIKLGIRTLAVVAPTRTPFTSTNPSEFFGVATMSIVRLDLALLKVMVHSTGCAERSEERL